jgi:hypothetical protein
MAIHFNQLRRSDEWRFRSSHWVHTEALGNKHLVTLTGIVVIDFKGTGGDWLRDRLNLTLRFPTEILPPDKLFQVELWAPFVTLNAIVNEQQAVNAGWAVDEFEGPGRVMIRDEVKIWADIAIRDIDGYLIRVGYSLTLVGTFADPPPGPF